MWGAQVVLASEFGVRMSYDPSQVAGLSKEFSQVLAKARDELKGMPRVPAYIKKQIRALLNLS
jgi:hypothetical protein